MRSPSPRLRSQQFVLIKQDMRRMYYRNSRDLYGASIQISRISVIHSPHILQEPSQMGSNMAAGN